MKSRFALLAMVVVAAAPLAAQGGGGGGGGRQGGGRGGMNIDMMTTQYTLTADQKTKAEALLKTYTDATAATQAWMRTEQQNGGTRNADSAKKVSDALATFNTAFKAILTADQSKKFDSVQAARAAGGGGRRGGGGGGQ